jgi:hypothetical protein
VKNWLPSDVDYACADMIIGVGIATIIMSAWITWQEFRPKDKILETIPEDEK